MAPRNPAALVGAISQVLADPAAAARLSAAAQRTAAAYAWPNLARAVLDVYRQVTGPGRAGHWTAAASHRAPGAKTDSHAGNRHQRPFAQSDIARQGAQFSRPHSATWKRTTPRCRSRRIDSALHAERDLAAQGGTEPPGGYFNRQEALHGVQPSPRPGVKGRSRWCFGTRSGSENLAARGASYPVQPSSLMAQPAFQILVMWLILPSSNSIT